MPKITVNKHNHALPTEHYVRRAWKGRHMLSKTPTPLEQRRANQRLYVRILISDSAHTVAALGGIEIISHFIPLFDR
jgi:hypothetical protein